MSIDKYKHIQKVLHEFGQDIISDLERVVGYDTGALKNSLDYDIKDDGIIIKMLDYGQYVNPWIKKTGSKREPGYIKILKRKEKEFYNALSDAFVLDIETELTESLKRYQGKNIKIRKSL